MIAEKYTWPWEMWSKKARPGKIETRLQVSQAIGVLLICRVQVPHCEKKILRRQRKYLALRASRLQVRGHKKPGCRCLPQALEVVVEVRMTILARRLIGRQSSSLWRQNAAFHSVEPVIDPLDVRLELRLHVRHRLRQLTDHVLGRQS